MKNSLPHMLPSPQNFLFSIFLVQIFVLTAKKFGGGRELGGWIRGIFEFLGGL
jgi:hypothetical protein